MYRQLLNSIDNLQAHYSDAIGIEKGCFVALMLLYKEKPRQHWAGGAIW